MFYLPAMSCISNYKVFHNTFITLWHCKVIQVPFYSCWTKLLYLQSNPYCLCWHNHWEGKVKVHLWTIIFWGLWNISHHMVIAMLLIIEFIFNIAYLFSVSNENAYSQWLFWLKHALGNAVMREYWSLPLGHSERTFYISHKSG